MTNEERKRRLRFVGELNNLCARYGLCVDAITDVLLVECTHAGPYWLDQDGVSLGLPVANPAHTSHHTPDEPSRSG